MSDVTKLLMGICDKCDSSEHVLVDDVTRVGESDVYIISGHCEGCTNAWHITVRVIEVEYRKV